MWSSVAEALVVEPPPAGGPAAPIGLGWRSVKWAGAACYAIALATSIARNGIPLDREALVGWTLGALAVHCIGRRWWMFGRALLDWLPFVLVMICYDLSRGAADRLGQAVHVEWPADADRALFSGVVPTEWLQHALHTPGVVHWYDIAASLVYFSYFLAVPVAMAVLWIRNRQLWLRFTANVVVLAFAALATFVLFPEAPPWYAAQQGVIGGIDRISALGWDQLGLHAATDLIEKGQAAANDVAAMPSLHTAYSMLIAVFFLRRVPRWIRPLLLAYPVAMGLTLVYTGEHWVVDVIAGMVFAVVVYAAISHVDAALSARRRSREPARHDLDVVQAAESPA